MANVKVPVKYSPAEAKAFLRAKLASNKDGLAGERRIKDQYAEYAKGGAVTKKITKLIKKVK